MPVPGAAQSPPFLLAVVGQPEAVDCDGEAANILCGSSASRQLPGTNIKKLGHRLMYCSTRYSLSHENTVES